LAKKLKIDVKFLAKKCHKMKVKTLYAKGLEQGVECRV
jgi:hypothetical protein